MKFLRALPLVIACSLAIPAIAQNDRYKEVYSPRESIAKQIVLDSSTENSSSFKFRIKAVCGNLKDVKFSAKVLGNNKIIPSTNQKEFNQLSQGQIATFEFKFPFSVEQIKANKYKVLATVEYLPDYNELIKDIEKNAETKYPNDALRDSLLSILNECNAKEEKSVEIIRYFPEK